MTAPLPALPPPAPRDNNTLIAQAQAEAQRLRRQAVRDFGDGMLDGMGDVWRCGNALWERGLSDSRRTLARSTARLHARWVAHQKWRTHTP